MKKSILTIAVLSTMLIACGPSAAEIAAKAKQELLDQQAADAAAAAEVANREALKQQVVELKAQFAGEESKMDAIQQWQLGRTEDEKAQQISDQTRVIEELKNQISETEKQINN
jgi:hypothetical protein